MAEFFGKNPDELLAMADKGEAGAWAVTVDGATGLLCALPPGVAKKQWETLAKSSLPTLGQSR